MAESGGYQHLRVERRGFAAWVILARPEVHNAFNAALIAELHAVFEADGRRRHAAGGGAGGRGPQFLRGRRPQLDGRQPRPIPATRMSKTR